jgi:hypothetical protein
MTRADGYRFVIRQQCAGGGSKMRFYYLPLLFLLSIDAAPPVAQASENPPRSSALIISRIAEASDEILIYHTPERLMGRLGRNEETVAKDWIVSMDYRCTSSCADEMGPLLKLLSSGTLSPKKAAGDLSTAIVFKSQSKEIGRVYGHWSGHGIIVNGETYTLERSLSVFLETHSPLQW